MTRAEKLFALLGGVEDRFIEEAASPVSRPKKQIRWKRWAALAACLLLVLAAPHLMPRMGSSAPMDPGNMAPSAGESVGSGATSDGAPAPSYGTPGGGNSAETPADPDTGSIGQLVAETTSPLFDEPFRLFFDPEQMAYTLTHGEHELLLPYSGQAEEIYLAVDGSLNGVPSHTLPFEHYVLIAFAGTPGEFSTYLSVGIEPDGSFRVTE